jgi:hypothetical protein
MKSSSRGKCWLSLTAAVLGGLVALLVVVVKPRHRAAEAASAEAAVAARLNHLRRDYPWVQATEPAPAQEAEAASAPVAAPFAPPPLTIPDDRGGPPASAQTATAWIGTFKDAVCTCKTRACVRDLQAGFLHTLGTMSYDEERDGAAYADSSRAAIRCYTELPADS